MFIMFIMFERLT